MCFACTDSAIIVPSVLDLPLLRVRSLPEELETLLASCRYCWLVKGVTCALTVWEHGGITCNLLVRPAKSQLTDVYFSYAMSSYVMCSLMRLIRGQYHSIFTSCCACDLHSTFVTSEDADKL